MTTTISTANSNLTPEREVPILKLVQANSLGGSITLSTQHSPVGPHITGKPISRPFRREKPTK